MSSQVGAREGSIQTPPLAGLLAGLRLALGVGEHEVDIAALDGITDWQAVVFLAKRHRVGSLLLSGANSVAQAHTVLTPLRQQTTTHGLRQLAGLRQATDRLAEAGIPSLVLKGLPLSTRLFGTPLARECIDIDLLIPADAVPTAGQVLSLGGWRLRKPSFAPTPARTRCYNRFVKDRLFVGPGGALELHHRLFSNPFLLNASFDRLSANAVNVEIGDRTFATLSDDDLLVYLAIHGQLHRWRRLKWLCDFAALLASIDEQRVNMAIEQCRRQKLRPEQALGAVLTLCRELFHVELPVAAASLPLGARARRAASLTRRTLNKPRGSTGPKGVAKYFDEIWAALAIKSSWRGVTHELARLCMAPYNFGLVNLPDRLFFLYVPLRPVLWLASRRQRTRKQYLRPRENTSQAAAAETDRTV